MNIYIYMYVSSVATSVLRRRAGAPQEQAQGLSSIIITVTMTIINKTKKMKYIH